MISIGFKDCVFTKGVWISSVENVIFENNTCFGLEVFNVDNVESLKFLNDNVLNCSRMEDNLSKIEIDLDVNRIEMIDSCINVSNYNNSEVNIDGLNTVIKNSTVEGAHIYINSYNINIDSSSKLIGNKSVGVFSKNDNLSLENVKAPYWFWNEYDSKKGSR